MSQDKQTEPGKLISDRGPAQPSGFAEQEGRKGPNDVKDQRPKDKSPSTPERHSQKELQNTLPLDPDPDDSAQP
jgi:hypothetical protein